MRRLLPLLCVLPVAGASPVAPVEAPTGAGHTVVLERTAWAMGTRVDLVVEAASRDAAAAAAEGALREVERLEALLSTWDAGSPMSRLNRAPVGAELPVAGELAALLAEAETWARRTGRAFEPAVGSLVDAWDLRGVGRRPSAEALAAARAASGPAGVAVDPERRTVRRRDPRAWIDTGAFGKGAALRAAVRALEERGVRRALVDLGGQVAVVGGGWTLDVAHPARRHEAVMRLEAADASVATSGASERGVHANGRRVGHLLDPRRGTPVPPWGSVTVVAADPVAADALATALFVLGPDEALAWARYRDEGVLVLEDRDGRVVPRWNRALEGRLAAGPGA